MAGIDTPTTLAADMLKAAGEAIVGTRAIVQKGSLNIKNDARKNVAQSAPTHNAHAQYAITYDTKVDARGLVVRGEIGYDKDINGGALGNLLEYGGGGDRSPAHRDLGRAFDSELPRFEDALAAFAGKLL
jgi:hypothetical protein